MILINLISKAYAVDISPYIPGMTQSSQGTSPGSFVAGFYKFALLAAGILAFGAIVYGGVLHAVSAGNPSRQTEGKQWIWSALLGLLLLAGAYLILNTINPKLLNLDLPTLTPIDNTTQSTSGGGITGQTGTVNCGGTTPGICPTGQVCNPNGGTYSCVTQNSFTCGGTTFGTCSGNQSCINGGSANTPSYYCSTQ